jgi:hypothetical protein
VQTSSPEQASAATPLVLRGLHQQLKALYREPDVYQVSKDVSGGLSQVQKTASKALLFIKNEALLT